VTIRANSEAAPPQPDMQRHGEAALPLIRMVELNGRRIGADKAGVFYALDGRVYATIVWRPEITRWDLRAFCDAFHQGLLPHVIPDPGGLLCPKPSSV
jgi:hypothetical protein